MGVEIPVMVMWVFSYGFFISRSKIQAPFWMMKVSLFMSQCLIVNMWVNYVEKVAGCLIAKEILENHTDHSVTFYGHKNSDGESWVCTA